MWCGRHQDRRHQCHSYDREPRHRVFQIDLGEDIRPGSVHQERQQDGQKECEYSYDQEVAEGTACLIASEDQTAEHD